MLAPDGSINENGAPFTGMMRYDARIAVEAALQEKVSPPPFISIL